MHKHRMSPAKAELELCMLLLLPGGEGQGEEKGDLAGGGGGWRGGRMNNQMGTYQL